MTATKLNPYLNFKDTTRSAMEFYQSVFGGKLDIQSFKEFGAPVEGEEGDLIMHAALETENGLTLMASDTPQHMDYRPMSCNISLSGTDENELRDYYEKLADGGTVLMPLEKAAWGDTFGMCTDKFGVGWLVNITAAVTT